MKKLSILLIITLFVMSCHMDSENKLSFKEDGQTLANAAMTEHFILEDNRSTSPPQTQSENGQNKSPDIEKGSKIIKEGNIHIEVDDLNSAKHYVDSLVSKNSAYYEKEIFRNSEYSQNYSLKIRIPSSNFNALVTGLELGGGKILEKFINAKDVTEEYIDLEIRLENNKAYLKRYKELLNKAKTIKEMIEIQEKIRQIEMLIDGSMGRMKFLDDKVKYSTLTLELSAKPKEYVAATPPTFFEDIIDAFKSGFSGLLYFILILANIWPVILGFMLIWIFKTRLFGRFFRKKTA